MTALTNPIPVFYDGRGVPLTGGYVYVGAASADPETTPINLFWDQALTVPAEQPLRTIGGLIVNGVTPALVFFAEANFSLRVRDTNGVLVTYSPSLYTNADDYQPKDADLTAIAVQGTTEYGRALLMLANQAALIAAIGGTAYLALTGGTVTGAITRQGAGVFPYFMDSALTGGRIFVTAAGAADPTSQPGDLWLTF